MADLKVHVTRISDDFRFERGVAVELKSATFYIDNDGPFYARVQKSDNWEQQIRDEIEKVRREVQAIRG